MGISGSEGNAAHEKDVKHYDQMPTVLETCPDVPYSETGPGQEALDSTSDLDKYDCQLPSHFIVLFVPNTRPTFILSTHCKFFGCMLLLHFNLSCSLKVYNPPGLV